MSKWGSRIVLIFLAAVVVLTLPYHVLSILARSLIAGRPLKLQFTLLVADLREVVGFLRTAWRDEDDGVDSGA